MSEEIAQPPSQAEARAALAEVDQIITQTRLAIAQGPSAPILILWGGIWLVADVTTQFYPHALNWLWLALDGLGIAGTWWFSARARVQVRRTGLWKVGVFWFALLAYAMLWMYLLLPEAWGNIGHGWRDFEPMYRRMTTYFHLVCMFGYVVFGLWFGRFFLALGLVVTTLILVGYYCGFPYYYIWLGVAGGGSLIVAGAFIRKFWK